MINLHPKEFETLAYVLLGRPYKEIASKQGVTEKAVKFHVCNILKKYGCKTRPELMAKFLDKELTSQFTQFLQTKANLEKIANIS
jgi:DNA-binding CsgD family transcriptional regulator